MPGYGPNGDMGYGAWLKWKFASFNSRGRTRTEQVIDEGHLSTGEAYKVTQDELGNRVRERSAEMGVSTGRDVTIRAPRIHRKATTHEERQ